MYPRNDLTYAENLLHMLFAVPSEHYQVRLSFIFMSDGRFMTKLMSVHAG